MRADPFPGERFTRLVSHLPAYARLAWRLGRDRRISRPRRAALIAAAGYLVSPIELIPGIIPVAGQLDDAFVGLTALRFALGGLTPEQRQEHLRAVALCEADLRGDAESTVATAGWMARAGARLTGRVALATARGTARAVVALARPLRERARRR